MWNRLILNLTKASWRFCFALNHLFKQWFVYYLKICFISLPILKIQISSNLNINFLAFKNSQQKKKYIYQYYRYYHNFLCLYYCGCLCKTLLLCITQTFLNLKPWNYKVIFVMTQYSVQYSLLIKCHFTTDVISSHHTKTKQKSKS